VRFDQQREAQRQEWFLAGTEQPWFAIDGVARGDAAADTASAKITSPVNGTILALDPDIPPQRQRLHLQSEGSPITAQWTLDHKPLGSGPRAQWLPWPGKHTIRLVDARGTTLDEVRIEVRGAGVKR
jgi:penicillin-binding protein 1C